MGVEDPDKIIEYAFARGGMQHFEAAIAQAEKFMDMSDEAFVEAESLIGETEVNMPAVEDVPEEEIRATARKTRGEEMKRRAASKSLVLSTQSEEDLAGDRSEMLQKVMPKPKLFGLNRLSEGNI
jgi:ribosomal protein S8E